MIRKYGNAQTIGTNLHQVTYFMTKEIKNCFLVLLADGTIDTVTGSCASILACEIAATEFVFSESVEEELDRVFLKTATALNERIYLGRKPKVSLLAACFFKNYIVWKAIGELSLSVFSHQSILFLEEPTGRRELPKKSQTMLCSRGIWQALQEVEVESILKMRLHPYEKAQRMIEEVNKKNRKEQENATLVLVE